MTHFCQNPECDNYNYTIEDDEIIIQKDNVKKIIKRVKYVVWSKEKGYETLYFCSVCIGVLDLLKISI